VDGVQSCTASWSAEQIWTDRDDRYDQFGEQVVQECIVSQLLPNEENGRGKRSSPGRRRLAIV